MPYFTKNLPVFSINYQRYIFYNLKLCECCVSETINGKEGTSSHLVTIPPGPHLTDALVSSPVLQVGNRTRRKLTTNIIGLKKILIFVISFSVGIFSLSELSSSNTPEEGITLFFKSLFFFLINSNILGSPYSKRSYLRRSNIFL